MPIADSPLLQSQQNGIDPVGVPTKRAPRLQQLLKDLVVGRKFDTVLNAEIVAPEFQRILQRLSGKVGGDGPCRCLLVRGVKTIQNGDSDPGTLQKRFGRPIEDLNVTDKSFSVNITLGYQCGVYPQRIGKIDV